MPALKLQAIKKFLDDDKNLVEDSPEQIDCPETIRKELEHYRRSKVVNGREVYDTGLYFRPFRKLQKAH
jgi:hypothetical protein